MGQMITMEENESLLVSIKEFSDFTGVKESILRYYDSIGLFRPVSRGENNYRYYSLTQLQTIKLIDTLRSIGVPLKRIQQIMKDRTPESMTEILAHYELEMNNELRALQESFGLVHMLRALIQSRPAQDEDKITVKYLEERHIALGPLTDFRPGEDYHRVFSNYYRTARSLRVNLGYPIGGYFDNVGEFFATPSQPKRYYSLDPNGLDVMRSGKYLVGYLRGDYGKMNDLPQRIRTYMDEQGIAQAGPVYQVYTLNELVLKDPKDYLQRIAIRID
jgi:DNA-binding transcriptional MerR regulator